jgi:hypothetical protein
MVIMIRIETRDTLSAQAWLESLSFDWSTTSVEKKEPGFHAKLEVFHKNDGDHALVGYPSGKREA